MIDLKKIRKIYFTGIKGVGMTALAVVAKDFGIKVEGSDVDQNFVTDQVLKKSEIVYQNGFNKENIGHPDLLIFTAAHQGEKNVEVLQAKKQNIPTLSHSQALGLFMQGKKGIATCGVGGKTTVASIIATIFDYADFHPSFAIGVAGINPLGLPGRYDEKGDYFIAEADEYFSPPPDSQPKFFFLKPTIIAISNLEYDHPDVYQDIDHTLNVFKTFVEKTPDNGLVTACIDNPNIKKLIQLTERKIVTYGFSPQADWQITSINQSQNQTIFSVKHKKFLIKNIRLSIPGEFNVKNATAGLVVANFCKIPFAKIKNGLAKFKGVKRRFEFIKKFNGIQLFDDYAHHPAQIQATLKAAKERFTRKRLIVVFQPHTYSRTKALLTDFAKSFTDADLVIITDIYASAREKYDPQISGRILVEAIRHYQPNVSFKKGEKEVSEFLKQVAKPQDVIFTLGAGDVFLWHQKIIKNLK
ncbi:MAG TPA: UDP-N-acetylmuramate--L-alanine ligase [Candidatus Bathyarchaeia archaeon]|nr:UDP-N-acetylmuramate--L-alanine ligase [Candidatus Bathyarchaeia archaeon]